jgi:hypothetical protein
LFVRQWLAGLVAGEQRAIARRKLRAERQAKAIRRTLQKIRMMIWLGSGGFARQVARILALADSRRAVDSARAELAAVSSNVEMVYKLSLQLPYWPAEGGFGLAVTVMPLATAAVSEQEARPAAQHSAQLASDLLESLDAADGGHLWSDATLDSLRYKADRLLEPEETIDPITGAPVEPADIPCQVVISSAAAGSSAAAAGLRAGDAVLSVGDVLFHGGSVELPSTRWADHPPLGRTELTRRVQEALTAAKLEHPAWNSQRAGAVQQRRECEVVGRVTLRLPTVIGLRPPAGVVEARQLRMREGLREPWPPGSAQPLLPELFERGGLPVGIVAAKTYTHRHPEYYFARGDTGETRTTLLAEPSPKGLPVSASADAETDLVVAVADWTAGDGADPGYLELERGMRIAVIARGAASLVHRFQLMRNLV